tara:strand:+ start:399 stop:1304 length:906 start_codon:yes stop_codon:yes gene_type:complete
MSDSTKNYYEILEVNETASNDEIKKKFRKLSLIHHPDKGGDVNKFKLINEAYQVIGDDKTRREYDNKRKFGGKFDGFPADFFDHMFGSQMNVNVGKGPFGFNFSNLGPNVQIFRNGQRVNVEEIQKPQKITQTLTINIEEAYTGCSKPIEVERWIRDDSNTRRIEKERLYVDIMAGIDDGETIILKEKGNIYSEKNKGDVCILIRVLNDTKLKRDGLNLILEKTLTLKESLCGFSFSFKHLNNKEYIINNVNSIIKPTYKKMIQNLGMKRGENTGNLFILFTIDFPDTLTEKQIEVLKETL